jgi:hypothetical protein
MDDLIIHLFRFKIEMRIILVEVEYFKDHPIALVKFYDKRDRNSANRFNVLTNRGNFQPILRTCINIMLHLYHQNPYLSFGFTGAQPPEEQKEGQKENTIRFRLYRYAIQQLFSNTSFLHLTVESLSHYFLINRDYCENNPSGQSEMLNLIKKIYPYEALWEEPEINKLIV